MGQSRAKGTLDFLLVMSLEADGFNFPQASQEYCKNLKRLETENRDEVSARRQAVRDFQLAYVAFYLVSSRENSSLITIRPCRSVLL